MFFRPLVAALLVFAGVGTKAQSSSGAPRYNIFVYNYCQDPITPVFTNDFPGSKGTKFPTVDPNGGYQSRWFETWDNVYYQTAVVAQTGYMQRSNPNKGAGSAVEFNFDGQYDITTYYGWSYPIAIQLGLDVGSGDCTLAMCSGRNCRDSYSYQSGLLSGNRQGDDYTTPNHYCSARNWNTINIQFCGQGSYLFGTRCNDPVQCSKQNANAFAASKTAVVTSQNPKASSLGTSLVASKATTKGASKKSPTIVASGSY